MDAALEFIRERLVNHAVAFEELSDLPLIPQTCYASITGALLCPGMSRWRGSRRYLESKLCMARANDIFARSASQNTSIREQPLRLPAVCQEDH